MNHFELIEKKGCKEVAFVYLLKSKKDENVLIECVESLDPPFSPNEKWVITLSSQKGCRVGCLFCDASYYFKGNLSVGELFDELNLILKEHENDNYLSSKKIKLHLARMGEPSLNDNVLDFLERVGKDFRHINFVPSIATVAPRGREKWFSRLKEIKDTYFSDGKFQLQFSLNTTNENQRDKFMPVKKIPYNEISAFADFWLKKGDRLITLNFALSNESEFYANKLINLFSKEKFLIKITPLNPGLKNRRMTSLLDYDGTIPPVLKREIDLLESFGFKVIISIGSKKEIEIGSNCGQRAFVLSKSNKYLLENIV